MMRGNAKRKLGPRVGLAFAARSNTLRPRAAVVKPALDAGRRSIWRTNFEVAGPCCASGRAGWVNAPRAAFRLEQVNVQQLLKLRINKPRQSAARK